MASTWMAVILIKDKWFPGFKQYAFDTRTIGPFGACRQLVNSVWVDHLFRGKKLLFWGFCLDSLLK